MLMQYSNIQKVFFLFLFLFCGGGVIYSAEGICHILFSSDFFSFVCVINCSLSFYFKAFLWDGLLCTPVSGEVGTWNELISADLVATFKKENIKFCGTLLEQLHIMLSWVKGCKTGLK